jgi:hypothetical protein
MIKVESKFKDFGIQIPTDISEITSEALDAILTNVVVAKHYCVVALCQNESLFGVINSKVSTVEVMPIIAKISKEDNGNNEDKGNKGNDNENEMKSYNESDSENDSNGNN